MCQSASIFFFFFFYFFEWENPLAAGRGVSSWTELARGTAPRDSEEILLETTHFGPAAWEKDWERSRKKAVVEKG